MYQCINPNKKNKKINMEKPRHLFFNYLINSLNAILFSIQYNINPKAKPHSLLYCSTPPFINSNNLNFHYFRFSFTHTSQNQNNFPPLSVCVYNFSCSRPKYRPTLPTWWHKFISNGTECM